MEVEHVLAVEAVRRDVGALWLVVEDGVRLGDLLRRRRVRRAAGGERAGRDETAAVGRVGGRAREAGVVRDTRRCPGLVLTLLFVPQLVVPRSAGALVPVDGEPVEERPESLALAADALARVAVRGRQG